MKIQDTTEIESKASLMLLRMVACAEKLTISSNISVLISVGLGDRGKEDFRLAYETCSALLKLVPDRIKSDSLTPPLRFEEDHLMFRNLKEILVSGITKMEDTYYIPMTGQAVAVIYQLADVPDIICNDLLKEICTIINKNYGDENGQLSLSSKILSRLLALFGHVAVRQMNHLDVNIFCELKRRERIKEEALFNKNKRQSKNKRASRKSLAADTTLKKDDEEDEDEIMGAVADDAEAEFIRAVCENEVVLGDSILGKGMALLVQVCLNPGKYSDIDLRTSATLSLAKCMLVSWKYCDLHLQLLFTILERTTEPTIRGNIIIALGDMSFRFPNLIEPWTPRIYARLRDNSNYVRKTTLTVLTHLILNDMVKVKGQISDMAMCIIDTDSKISGLSKLFFTELAQKGNSLYNVMPDIISRMSDPDAGVPEDDFQTVLSFIIGLIQKERQSDSLVEKLLYRLSVARMERQWRDLAYCISLLSCTDRSLRKVQENFQFLVDKLQEEKVFEYFTQMLQNAKKLAKPEVKVLVEELEKRMEEVREKGIDEVGLATKAAQSQKATQAQ
ncbi:condensin complex subunit 1-like [Artemia franciscana]|uniref:condensin complex subunit 1-like n=1 Tax=Artemia franciscana TaxID=6661 RepID=UPI0032D9FDC8